MREINKYAVIASLLMSPVLLSAETLMTDTGFTYPANKKHSDSTFLGYLEPNANFGNRCHLANDYNLPQGSSVFATDKGEVISANANIPGYNSAAGDAGAIIIKHQTSNGTVFYGLYGHIKNLTVAARDTVSAGQKIAEVGPYSFGEHLHFGINTVSANIQGYTPSTACTDHLGFVNPESFLTSNYTAKASCKAVNDSITTAKETIVTSGNVLINDINVDDNDTLTISAAAANSVNGVVITNNADGTFTYTPAVGFTGTDSFTYTVTDSNGCTDDGVVSVTVTGGTDSGGGTGSGGDVGSGGDTDSGDSSGGGLLSAFGLFGFLSILLSVTFRKRT